MNVCRFDRVFCRAFALALIGITALSSRASCGIIFEDDFDRTGALDGSSVTKGNLTWQANPNLASDGTAVLLGNAAFLPFTPVSGKIYRLEALIKHNGPEGPWAAFGFATRTRTQEGSFVQAAMPAPWMVIHYWGNSVDIYGGPGTENKVEQSQNSPFERQSYNLFAIVLDTRNDRWKARFYVNDVEIGEDFVYDENPSIVAIGIGNKDAKIVDAFSVDKLSLSENP